MDSIYNELTGGFDEKKRKEEEERIKNSYDVFIQFDEDEPILAFPTIDKSESIVFELNALDENETDQKKDRIFFRDKLTGKSFTMFVKLKN